MSSEPIQGEPRRRLIAVTRRRVALAAAALLGALWLALVGRLQAGDDPALKERPSGAPAATTETTTTETPTTETTPAQTETTPAQTETTATEPETQTETTEQKTTEEQPSASTTEQS